MSRVIHMISGVGHGPLTRYVKLWVAHAPGMPGTFSQSSTSMETASYWSQYAPRHVLHACAHGGRKTFPAIPAHAQPTILRICQQAHSKRPATPAMATKRHTLFPGPPNRIRDFFLLDKMWCRRVSLHHVWYNIQYLIQPGTEILRR